MHLASCTTSLHLSIEGVWAPWSADGPSVLQTAAELAAASWKYTSQLAAAQTAPAAPTPFQQPPPTPELVFSRCSPHTHVASLGFTQRDAKACLLEDSIHPHPFPASCSSSTGMERILAHPLCVQLPACPTHSWHTPSKCKGTRLTFTHTLVLPMALQPSSQV